jgi:uncharacterized membrane protein YfcA
VRRSPSSTAPRRAWKPELSALHALAIVGAGVGAGIANAIVGSGTLITFPTLLAFGYAPVTANVSNTIGLVPGNVTSMIGYRPEMAGQRQRGIRLGIASLIGAAGGATLLLVLPASAFRAVVPAFIGLGVFAILTGPYVSKLLARRNVEASEASGGVATFLGIVVCGVYGGYFGAGQGLLYIAVLGIAIADTLHRLNALRNLLAGLANTIAAVVFIASAHVAWDAAGLIAIGSIAGGWVGVHIGRRLPPTVYRAVIAAVGIVAFAKLV